jgi:hypothetical protein
MRLFLATVVLIPFLAFTTWVLADVGYIGLFAHALRDAPGQQVLIDVFLACSMLLFFIYRDAKERGVTFWPWVVLTVATGSIGPLLYFVYTGWLGRKLALNAQPSALPTP